MMTTITLLLLLLTVTLSLGGGLYEILVIYPNWKYDVDPHTLSGKLESSGQNNAGKRFWPLVSPAQGLLAIINIVLAYNYIGAAHDYWLVGSVIVFVSRLLTFAYFIPEMVRKIMRPESIEKARLQAIVKTWTGLSPWRLLPEFFAWIVLALALMQF
jgi:membrane protein YdbS with pleckstrin-like domain